MNCEGSQKKVALIVDDDQAFREIHGPALIKEIFDEEVDVVGAESALEGIKALLRLQQENKEILLTILDMHMPPKGQSMPPSNDAGLQFLHFIGFLKERLNTKIVVYTAYPRYENCVASLRSGAADYIPKFRENTSIAYGAKYLVSRCRMLFAPTPDRGPSPEWAIANRGVLEEKFAGKWVALLNMETGRRCNLQGEEIGGMMVIADDAYYQLLDRLLVNDDFIGEPFTTWAIPRPMTVTDKEEM